MTAAATWRVRFAWLAASSGVGFGCAAAGEAEPRSPEGARGEVVAATAEEAPRAPRLPEAGVGELLVRERSVALDVPDRARWRALPARGEWSGFAHAPSQSEIWVSHRLARRSVTAEECEREARGSLSLLRGAAEEAVREPASLPGGYYGSSTVEIFGGGRGRVAVFGAGVSRCLSLVFVTPGDEEMLDRLRLLGLSVFPSARVVGVEERSIRPER